MARFLRPARLALASCSSPKTVIPSQNPRPFLHARNYIAEMAKNAFESNILRILRTEIDYQNEYVPPKQPDKEFSHFTIEDWHGQQWMRLRRKYGEREDIKIEVTMFDGAALASKSGEGDDVRLHISLIVDIAKGEDSGALQFICSAWPESLEIQKVFLLKQRPMLADPYTGPNFVELDDELQSSLQEFLELRGVNDDLAVFLHEYMRNKDKTELVHWMGKVKSFVEK